MFIVLNEDGTHSHLELSDCDKWYLEMLKQAPKNANIVLNKGRRTGRNFIYEQIKNQNIPFIEFEEVKPKLNK